jgi:hypothetical protein
LQGGAHLLRVLQQHAALPAALRVALDFRSVEWIKLTIEASLRPQEFNAQHAALLSLLVPSNNKTAGLPHLFHGADGHV